MDIYIMSIFCLLLSFYGYKKDEKIINPLFIMPVIWGVFLLLYKIIPHRLYELQEQFLFSLLIWVVSFLVGGYLIQSRREKTIAKNSLDNSLYNKLIFNCLFYLVLFLAPLTVYVLITEAMKVGFEYFFLKLRMINTGIDEDDTFSLGFLAYVFNLANVVLLLFTFYKEKVSNLKYYIVLVLAIILGLITLARTSLVVLLLSIFVILYFKKLLKPKHYIYGFTIFFLFLFVITFLREFHESDSSALEELQIYLFAGMPAFDTIDYKLQEQFGSYTLRFYYAVSNAFGGNYVVEKTILPYTTVPTLTNVYTVMFPFFKDFGFYGIAFFGFLYGLFINLIYKIATTENSLGILGYSIIFPILLLQFFGEYLFSNFSTYLQYLIILLIPKFFKFVK